MERILEHVESFGSDTDECANETQTDRSRKLSSLLRPINIANGSYASRVLAYHCDLVRLFRVQYLPFSSLQRSDSQKIIFKVG